VYAALERFELLTVFSIWKVTGVGVKSHVLQKLLKNTLVVCV